MPKPYSDDLETRREAAESFSLSPSSAVRWLQRWRDTGSARAKLRRRSKNGRTWRGTVGWIRKQGLLDPARLVFIDETATGTSLVRLRRRCPRGERLVGSVPHATGRPSPWLSDCATTAL
jgi:hypothetical protein